MHCVADCIIRRFVPQATEWQRIGNQISAIMCWVWLQTLSVCSPSIWSLRPEIARGLSFCSLPLDVPCRPFGTSPCRVPGSSELSPRKCLREIPGRTPHLVLCRSLFSCVCFVLCLWFEFSANAVCRLTRIRLQAAIYFCLHRGKYPVKGCTAGWQARSPLFEFPLVLVRLDHAASFIVNADHSIMCAAVVFRIFDFIVDL